MEWTGCLGSHGRYGSVSAMGESWLAHRLVYTLFVGAIPDGMNICHKCDNGLCINPDHLFLGTQKDNVLDMEGKKRSRHPSGENHGRAKLTRAQVACIRSEHAGGSSARSLARKYGVNRVNIRAIIKNETWVTT